MTKLSLRFIAALGLSAAASGVFAQSPFEATATNTDIGVPVSLRVGSSNFLDFVDDLVNSEGAFQPLDGRPFDASMTFLGVANAARFTANSTGTSVTLTLAPIGFTRTFTGADSRAVNDQVEEFFEKDGAATYAAFLKAIARTSPIAVTDGNPSASTALAARSAFMTQGFTSVDELSAADDGTKPKFGGVSFGMNGGKFDAAGFKGSMYSFAGTVLNFGGETVRFVVPVDFNFLKFDAGSQVGGAGINFCLPIRAKIMSKENPWNWRITPLAGVSLRGSVDLASLSPIWQFGAVNTIDYRVNKKLVIGLVNQLTTHQSFSMAYDDFEFDPDIDQQILKNGVRVVTPFTDRWTGDVFVVDTRFLKDAAVEQFWTLGASVTLRATKSWSVVVGANYDTGDDFKAYSVGLSSAWKW